MPISWEDELPVKNLPEDPTWRENFCFDGYDRKNDVGFWIHCGRWSLDPSIWREQVLVYWPGDIYYVHRHWGYRPSDNGPSGALLDLICEEPGKAWRLRYRGPTRRTDTPELHRGPLTEAPQQLMDLDIRFTTEREMWDMTAGIEKQDWGKFHIEQTGRFQGSIKVGDETVPMDGLGWHDHSRGPRDVSAMGRHCWIHGNLSKGRSFALTFIEDKTDAGFVRKLEKAVVWDENGLHDATCPNPPFLQSADAPPPGYEMTLEYDGQRVDISAQAKRSLPHSTTRYMECFDGVTPGQAHVVTYEQGTILTVDGEEHDGHTERSYLLG